MSLIAYVLLLILLMRRIMVRRNFFVLLAMSTRVIIFETHHTNCRIMKKIGETEEVTTTTIECTAKIGEFLRLV